MPAYNADATAGNEVVVRKLLVPLTSVQKAPPTQGQLWPRGDKRGGQAGS